MCIDGLTWWNGTCSWPSHWHFCSTVEDEKKKYTKWNETSILAHFYARSWLIVAERDHLLQAAWRPPRNSNVSLSWHYLMDYFWWTILTPQSVVAQEGAWGSTPSTRTKQKKKKKNWSKLVIFCKFTNFVTVIG